MIDLFDEVGGALHVRRSWEIVRSGERLIDSVRHQAMSPFISTLDFAATFLDRSMQQSPIKHFNATVRSFFMIAPAAQKISNIETVTRSTFAQRVLESSAPVAVEFMSYGCSHCRTLEPFLQQAAGMIAGKERVFRVNVAIQPQLAVEYGVEGTPTLVMFRSGKEVGRVEGPSPTLTILMSALTEPFRS